MNDKTVTVAAAAPARTVTAMMTAVTVRELKLVDGTYPALLSTERRSEPLEAAITITDGQLTALATPPALITPTTPLTRNH